MTEAMNCTPNHLSSVFRFRVKILQMKILIDLDHLLLGDHRSYDYAVGMVSVPCGTLNGREDLVCFVKIIPRVCHNINKICFIFEVQ